MEEKTMPRVRPYGNFEGCFYRNDMSREEFERMREEEWDRFESVYKIKFNEANLTYTLIEEDSKKGARVTILNNEGILKEEVINLQPTNLH